MSLEEKTKKWGCYHCSCCRFYHGFAKGCELPRCAYILVSFAQQEIDKLKTFRDNAYKKWCESQDKFESKIQSDQNVIEELVRERGLQKQKLQQIAVEIENLRRHNHYDAETDKWLIPQRQLFALEKQANKVLGVDGKEKAKPT